MKETVYLLLILLFTISCQRNEIVKTHGIAYLEKREKLIFVNKSNKNDTINIFGQPSTKGMTNDNLWIYIERTMTKGKMFKLGRNYLTKNNFKYQNAKSEKKNSIKPSVENCCFSSSKILVWS